MTALARDRVTQMSNNSNRLHSPDLPVADGATTKRVLTPREREVLGQITSGASNKEAGLQLGISSRTVEVHRSRIMDKLNARNAADLVRIVLTGQIDIG
jgi:DNA-binding NarL/FixJ family response regulator